MNILIAGFGNIGKALCSIMEKHKIEGVNYSVCDINNGINCLDYIKDNKNNLDAVVNLTTQATDDVLNLCNNCGLDYIDCGIEDFPENLDAYDYYNKLLKTKTENKILLGFGMNPGLAEFIYFNYCPNKNHMGIIFEFDDGKKDGKIFNTWSASSYFDEAVKDDKFIAIQNKGMVNVTDKMKDIPYIVINTDGYDRKYRIIPHEEVFSLCRVNKKCDASAFVYQAPVEIQKYFCDFGNSLDEQEVKKMKTLYDIEGEETVGVLFYDYSDNLRYVYNRISHPKIYDKYKTNGTCWQTACGAYVAIKLLPYIKNKSVVTMSDVAVSHKGIIEEALKELEFKIEARDNYVKAEDFKNRLLPIFNC